MVEAIEAESINLPQQPQKSERCVACGPAQDHEQR